MSLDIEKAKRLAAEILKDPHNQGSYKRAKTNIGQKITAGARRNWINDFFVHYDGGVLGSNFPSTEEREAIRLVLDKIWRCIAPAGANEYAHVANFPAVIELIEKLDEIYPQPKAKAKEPTMNETKNELSTITVENVTMINGRPASEYSDAQLYKLIANEEAAIENLSRIKRKPKRLEAEIARRQAAIENLVTYLDAQV